jgi:SAM-dependent methyltransferase
VSKDVGENRGSLSDTLAGVAELYSRNLTEHGLGSRSVGWRDEASQQLRFSKLADVIEPDRAQRGITVNDLGCGYGAMFRFLDGLPGVRLERYVGYDISEEMLAAGRRFVPDERVELVHGAQVTEVADYSFVSGTFNVRFGANDEVWGRHVEDTIVELARASRHGFAFNLLSTYVDWKKEDLFYADPFRFFDFCKRNISRYVSLLHDYPLYEWTILVRMEEP